MKGPWSRCLWSPKSFEQWVEHWSSSHLEKKYQINCSADPNSGLVRYWKVENKFGFQAMIWIPYNLILFLNGISFECPTPALHTHTLVYGLLVHFLSGFLEMVQIPEPGVQFLNGPTKHSTFFYHSKRDEKWFRFQGNLDFGRPVLRYSQ